MHLPPPDLSIVARRADIVATRPDGTRWLYAAGPSGKVVGKGLYTGR